MVGYAACRDPVARLEEVAVLAEHYDIVILGGGPAGYGTALYGAAAGLHVALVEEGRVGGTCLHRGCVPAKELLQTAEVLRTISALPTSASTPGTPRSTSVAARPASRRSWTVSRRVSRAC